MMPSQNFLNWKQGKGKIRKAKKKLKEEKQKPKDVVHFLILNCDFAHARAKML